MPREISASPTSTRRLHLLRHAKSSWEVEGLPDAERPLSPRGEKAARRMRRWLAESDVRPEIVLCSTALRARETLDHVLPALGRPRILFEPGLYHAATGALLDRVLTVQDDVVEVLIVGHNPGLEGLIELLASRTGAVVELPQAFPTGALATLVTDHHAWRELQPASMTLTALVLPRRLD